MPELQALIESVNQLNDSNEELAVEVTDLRAEIANLPAKFIPRSEAEKKAEKLRNRLRLYLGAGILVAAVAGGGIWNNDRIEDKFTQRCISNRSTIRDMISIAVADRPTLPSADAVTAQAIEELNQRSIRPLRERLLSLDGAQPEKC